MMDDEADPLESYRYPVEWGTNERPPSILQLVPPYAIIPTPYRAEFGEGKPWVELADQLFFKGGKHVSYSMQEGVKSHYAFVNLQTILGSYELKHEHKIAATAYLMSRWFERFEILG